MSLACAVKLAVELIRAEAKRIAFDANLADKLHVTDSFAVKASQRRRELLAAVDVLATLAADTGAWKKSRSVGGRPHG